MGNQFYRVVDGGLSSHVLRCGAREKEKTSNGFPGSDSLKERRNNQSRSERLMKRLAVCLAIVFAVALAAPTGTPTERSNVGVLPVRSSDALVSWRPFAGAGA